jgi:hypothetical protein
MLHHTIFEQIYVSRSQHGASHEGPLLSTAFARHVARCSYLQAHFFFFAPVSLWNGLTPGKAVHLW